MPEEFTWSVSELNGYIKDRLEGDDVLRTIWVHGEVSNLRRPSSGHIYFSLKDAQSSIACVVWRTQSRRLSAPPREGEAVLARGSISLYLVNGTYQLSINEMQAQGAGRLHLEFEALKARLAVEGLFDADRKRPVPAFPHAIGVVTSPQAAALQDVLKVLRTRYPLAPVILSPTMVQGEGAPAQIASALKTLNARRKEWNVDVILLVRGGGSLEDLWAFNDERVARAIVDSELPVITGIGHEIDFTIADLAADWRAPTPTAAAVAATPNQIELRQQLLVRATALRQSVEVRLEAARSDTHAGRLALEYRAPRSVLAQGRRRVDDLLARAVLGVRYAMGTHHTHLAGLRGRLQGLAPSAVLGRGYAIVRWRDSGQVVVGARQVSAGMRLRIQWQDGQTDVQVESE